MQRTQPVIGILLDSEQGGGYSDLPHYALTRQYFDAIAQAGGMPLGLPHLPDLMDTYLDMIDGLLVPGGDYKFPAAWYADGAQSGYDENPARLALEEGMIRRALTAKKPVYAICCGMQVMAVIGGSKLVSQLPVTTIDHRQGEKSRMVHTLTVTPDTLLHSIAGDTLSANSNHREGIATAGPDCIISARAEDGVIEAIEIKNHPFALGVQWHPESCVGDAKNMAVFRAFVKACTS